MEGVRGEADWFLLLLLQDKWRSHVNETDALRRELKVSRSKLEEEQKTRVKIEQQLDQHNEKVRFS